MSKFLESFKNKYVNIHFLSNQHIQVSSDGLFVFVEGYLIDEDETYYYFGSNNFLDVDFSIRKDQVIGANTISTK